MRRWLLLALSLIVTGCGAAGTEAPASTPSPSFSAAVQRPERSVTPGVIHTVNLSELCPLKTKRVDLTIDQKITVLRRYHLPPKWAYETGPHRHIAEWDHYVALGEGGGNGVHNIWPQRYFDQKRAKDALEAKLHDAICHHGFSVTEAQYQLLNFWRYLGDGGQPSVD